MILFLVDYECFTVHDADRIICALVYAAQYQLDHSFVDVLTYHFSKPSPTEPTKLRFIELYKNDSAFWEHAADPSVMRGLSITFDPTIRKSFTWRAIYLGNVDQKVKDSIIAMGGYEINPIFSHYDARFRNVKTDSGIFCIARALDTKENRFAFESLSPVFSTNAVYHFVFKDKGDDLYMIVLWPDINTALENIGKISNYPINFDLLHVYARKEAHHDLLNRFKPWKPTLFDRAEAGYWLHPES